MPYQKEIINPISGQRLREELKNKGLSHAQFAKTVDLDPKVIGFYCQGRRRITEKRAEQFAGLLGVRAEYLLGLDDFRTTIDYNRSVILQNSDTKSQLDKEFLNNIFKLILDMGYDIRMVSPKEFYIIYNDREILLSHDELKRIVYTSVELYLFQKYKELDTSHL